MGQKIFLQLKTPQNQGRPIFPVPITVNMVIIKETTAVCTSSYFTGSFLSDSKSVALLIHSTVNILKYSTLSSEINVISCDSPCYFFQCFFFFSLLI